MKRIVLYLLFALLLVSCGKQSQTLSELKSEYVTIDDSIRVHYKIWNESVDSDAKTICFVHGFGCDMNTWEKQFEAFRDGKDLQLVFIDLPGYGLSDKPHVEYTLDFFAHAIDEVLNVNSIKDAVFVGHSLGTPVCRQTLMTTGHKGALVDVDGVYCFYDGTETPEYVEAVNQFGHAFDGDNPDSIGEELHTHEHNHLFIVTEGEAKILLGDEEVIIHKDEAFLVEGRIPHSCWNNIEGVTKMIGITVV